MTILEQLQSAFPDVEGIGDARNIAEALAMISGAGGRGANAIADKVSNPGGDIEGVWDWVAENGKNAISSASEAIGTKARYIGSSAFTGCSSLTAVTFPNVSYIGSSAFAGCSNLTSVSFPNVSYIGSYAFAYCFSLTDVSFPNASYIGEGAFTPCNGLTTVSFPNASYIESNAFTGCSSLTAVTFPNVSYIGSSAFNGCESLASASFPNAIYIGSYAFAYCFHLISLYLTGGSMSQVPSLSASAFNSTPIGGYSASAEQYGSVYVPASLYSAFLSAENWSSIASRIVSVLES